MSTTRRITVLFILAVLLAAGAMLFRIVEDAGIAAGGAHSELAQLGPVTYYVSTAGNDANAGTQAAPWSTLQKAAASVNPGDTVMVESGIYTASAQILVDLTRSGSAAAPITFMSASPHGAVLDGGNNTEAIAVKYESGASYIRFQGFEIRNFSQMAFDVNGIHNNGIQLIGNYVHDIGRICTDSAYGNVGAYFAVSDSSVVSGNVWDNIGRLAPGQNGCVMTTTNYMNHDQGLYLDAVTNMLVDDNIFYNDERGWPIQVYGNHTPSDHLSIINNTFAFANPDRDGQVLLSSPGVTNSTIENNIFYQPRTSGVYISQTAGLTFSGDAIDHNLTYGGVTASSASFPGFSIGGNLDNTDPKLSGPASFDFHLTSVSPAIDAGASESSVTTDLDGNSRPQGAGYDIGAYEFVRPVQALIGDFNHDGHVNSLDYSMLISAWGGNNPTYDLNGDGVVNTLDYVILVQHWTG